MKTLNFKLDLMQPGTANKDILYNENLQKIDNMLNISVSDFARQEDIKMNAGDKYIIIDGLKRNQICFKPSEHKPAQYQPANKGMLLFIQEKDSFFNFNGNEWQQVAEPAPPQASQVAIASNSILKGDENFTAIEDEYVAPADHEFLYLYVNNDVLINLDNVKTRQILIIIKNHYQDPKTLTWPENILWPNKEPHILTAKQNAIDIIRIYRLIETNHFLGEIVGQDYQF